ncbi:AAA family ATPase [Andreprevotia lacus]|uniref:AAA family ATPase n=1 Tax=Andreprevotia lacus TaxID=1121000 RepID=UPI0015948210|nr:AAA family ATPase [Andreprevotia lacus]
MANRQALEQRFEDESSIERRKQREGLMQLADPKPLVLATAQHFEAVQQAFGNLPHLQSVVQHLLEQLKLQVVLERPLKLGPLLLGGEPGNGKSWLMHQLAACLELPKLEFQLAGTADTLQLAGSSRNWSNAAPGRLVQFLAHCPVANPLILFEEVDKSGASSHGVPNDILLMLLEPENARTFEDKYLGVPVDVSHCSYVLTANNVNLLSAPLLSRCQLSSVRPPHTEAAWRDMVRMLYTQMLNQEGLTTLFMSELPDETETALIDRCVSLRALRRRLAQGIAAAIAQYADPQQLKEQGGALLPLVQAEMLPRRGVGFLG